MWWLTSTNQTNNICVSDNLYNVSICVLTPTVLLYRIKAQSHQTDIKAGVLHTAKTTADSQLACMFCTCVRGNIYHQAVVCVCHLIKETQAQDRGYTNRCIMWQRLPSSELMCKWVCGCVWLTGAVAYCYSFTLRSIPIQSRQRDLVFLIVLHPLQDGPLTLTTDPQLKWTYSFTTYIHFYNTLCTPSTH